MIDWIFFALFEVVAVAWGVVALVRRRRENAYIAAAFACLIPIGSYNSEPLRHQVGPAVVFAVDIACSVAVMALITWALTTSRRQ